MEIVEGAGHSRRYCWAKDSRIAREQLKRPPLQHPGDQFADA